jgi:hypothetical protein
MEEKEEGERVELELQYELPLIQIISKQENTWKYKMTT